MPLTGVSCRACAAHMTYPPHARHCQVRQFLKAEDPERFSASSGYITPQGALALAGVMFLRLSKTPRYAWGSGKLSAIQKAPLSYRIKMATNHFIPIEGGESIWI